MGLVRLPLDPPLPLPGLLLRLRDWTTRRRARTWDRALALEIAGALRTERARADYFRHRRDVWMDQFVAATHRARAAQAQLAQAMVDRDESASPHSRASPAGSRANSAT